MYLPEPKETRIAPWVAESRKSCRSLGRGLDGWMCTPPIYQHNIFSKLNSWINYKVCISEHHRKSFYRKKCMWSILFRLTRIGKSRWWMFSVISNYKYLRNLSMIFLLFEAKKALAILDLWVIKLVKFWANQFLRFDISQPRTFLVWLA